MKAYKVVKKCESGIYRSAFFSEYFDQRAWKHWNSDEASSLPKSIWWETLGCEYIVGEFTLPLVPDSRIFAFNSIQNAINWMNIRRDSFLHLFEAEVEGVEEEPGKFFVRPTPERIVSFLSGDEKMLSGDEKMLRGDRIPLGTMAVQKLKLMEEINVNDYI